MVRNAYADAVLLWENKMELLGSYQHGVSRAISCPTVICSDQKLRSWSSSLARLFMILHCWMTGIWPHTYIRHIHNLEGGHTSVTHGDGSPKLGSEHFV
jgi:hypothetical protein